MRGVGVLKDTPWYVWACGTIIVLAVLTSFVVLSVTGEGTEEFARFMNTMMNAGGLLVGTITAALAGSAAVNAKRALEKRDRETEEGTDDGES